MAQEDYTIDITSKKRNALKAALLIRTAEPRCWSSPHSNPPGIVIPTAKVIVVISIATTK